MTLKGFMIGGAALLGSATIVTTAQAVPYAFGNNQITGLALTQTLNGVTSPLGNVRSATQSIQANSNYGAAPGLSAFNSNSVGTALDINQVYSGPGPAPISTFTPIGPGNFTGTRADSTISGFIGNTVNVSNVAEGYGTSAGGSAANNTATVTFQVLGVGQTIQLSFTDSYNLISSTNALVNEKATASLANDFTVAGGPSAISIVETGADISSLSVTSQFGVPSVDTKSATVNKTYTTGILQDNVLYTLTFASSVLETITPGIPNTTVPEPASLGVLGLGMLAVGIYRRRRQG